MNKFEEGWKNESTDEKMTKKWKKYYEIRKKKSIIIF